MTRLNGAGHEKSLARLQKRLRTASPDAKPHALRKLLKDVGGVFALILCGGAIGAGAFLALDSLRSPDAQANQQMLSLRAPFYQTCREALQDGRANLRRGEPGYRAQLDADNDGVACEPYLRR